MTLASQQQAMLDALFGRWDDTALRGLATQDEALRVRGLKAYRSNGHALAQRALAAAYPVVAMMLGDDNFSALARAFWHACPPVRGDIAQWGSGLADFVAQAAQLREEPHLPDVARAEWALHEAAAAADVAADPASFGLLMERDPAGLALRLAAGLQVVTSQWPVATLVNAHLCGKPALADAAQKLHEGIGETAVIWRQGFKPVVREAAAGEAALLAALQRGGSLATALDAASASAGGFDFNAWLVPAFQSGLVAGAAVIQPEE